MDPKWDLGDFWIMALQRRSGYRMAQGVRHAKEMLESGFTTVRDVGNAGDYLDADLDKAIRFGVVAGPTMIYAGRIIAPFGRPVSGQADRRKAYSKIRNTGSPIRRRNCAGLFAKTSIGERV